MVEVGLGLVEDLVGDGTGVDVRPPVASESLLAAHCMKELRDDLLAIL